ncbi:MAG TPA: nucleotidyltransferase domain-containing protein [Candidatus Hodarchaeales archaeon]|nr:nucleotidyltransferase domain-containing protein [Candidatus Hodarchaeales archaeon]
MERWEKAVNEFIDEFSKSQEVEGVLVCGSFVTGAPDKHSDIDVHIILPENVGWRERGNKIVDGFLIEYFSNPPAQIRRYFKDDFEEFSRMSPTQFSTGRILYDQRGIVSSLKHEATEIMNHRFRPLSELEISRGKYNLWDILDDFQSAVEEGNPSLVHLFHSSVKEAIDFFRKYLGYDRLTPSKIYKILTSTMYREKYLLSEFPDETFGQLALKCLTCKEESNMLFILTDLVNYILERLGGFSINGWKLHSVPEV